MAVDSINGANHNHNAVVMGAGAGAGALVGAGLGATYGVMSKPYLDGVLPTDKFMRQTLENLTKVLDVTATDLFANSDKKSNDILYKKIINQIKTIKNDTAKLETLEIVLKGLV